MLRCSALLTLWATCALPAVRAARAADAPPAGSADSAPIARLHFAGSDALLADKKAAATLNVIASMPQTAVFADDALKKLATAPYRLFLQRNRLPLGATDEAALLRPLLEDLLHRESYLELRPGSGDVPELVLSVRVPDPEAARWQANLAQVLTNWTRCPATPFHSEGFDGWEVRKHHDPDVLRLLRARDWVVFAWGAGDIAGLPPTLRTIAAQGGPAPSLNGPFLECHADFARLLPRQDALDSTLDPALLPRMDLSLALRDNDDDVHTTAVLRFPKPLALQLSPWVLPSALAHSPLINFTAIRGISPWLTPTRVFTDLGLQPAPDQWFAWGMFGVPFDAYLAAYLPNAADVIARHGAAWASAANTNLQSRGWAGDLVWDETSRTLRWADIVPLVSPTLRPTSVTNGDFLFLTLFAQGRRAPPPAGLFAEVAAGTDVVYYSWELGSPTLIQAFNLMGIYLMLRQSAPDMGSSPAELWMLPLSLKLRGAVTEVKLTAPNELTVTRQSQVGLSAVELALLMHWEMTDSFPIGGPLGGPPAQSARRHKRRPGAPAPPAGLGVSPLPDQPPAPANR